MIVWTTSIFVPSYFFSFTAAFAAVCGLACSLASASTSSTAFSPAFSASAAAVAFAPEASDVTRAEPKLPTPPTSADDLLTQLEIADVGLVSLTAGIQYVRVSGIMGDVQTREGTLTFLDERTQEAKQGVTRKAEGDNPAIEATPADISPEGLVATTKVIPPSRRFAVRFDKLQLGTRVERADETYVFDGANLAHVEPAKQQVTMYEVAFASKGRDPLKLGEGPLPLPIAQKREDILRRFDVTLLGAAADLEGETVAETSKLHTFVDGAYQLKLVPKPEFASSMDSTEIRLWYRATIIPGTNNQPATSRLLPRMARTVNNAGDVAMVRLINVAPNASVDANTMTFDTIPDGWVIIRRELAGPATKKASPAEPASEPASEPAPTR